MIIGETEYSEILILDADNGLVASITDTDIIGSSGYKVVCVPVQN